MWQSAGRDQVLDPGSVMRASRSATRRSWKRRLDRAALSRSSRVRLSAVSWRTAGSCTARGVLPHDHRVSPAGASAGPASEGLGPLRRPGWSGARRIGTHIGRRAFLLGPQQRGREFGPLVPGDGAGMRFLHEQLHRPGPAGGGEEAAERSEERAIGAAVSEPHAAPESSTRHR